MTEKFPPVLKACLSTGAVIAGMVAYLLMPPGAAQILTTAFAGPTPSPEEAARHPEIQRIQAAEAKSLPNPLFVDVRTQVEYERGHIMGAVWAPSEHILQKAAELPKDRPLVLYCT